MNDDRQLPEDLARLEGELAARRLPEPPPGLRGRVLAGIQCQTQPPAPATLREGLLPYAAAVAALLLVCMNLSMSAVNGMDWELREEPPRVDIASQARELQRLLPDLPEGEALRIVRVTTVRHPLPLVPQIKGRSPWATATESIQTETIYRELNDGIRATVD